MMRNIRHAFRFYTRFLTTFISVGLFATILVVHGLAQEGVPVDAPSWMETVSGHRNAPQVERAILNQKVSDGSVRPWSLLARHEGMRHDNGEHEYGERVAPTFSRLLQSSRFILPLILGGILALILLAYRLWWYRPLVPVIVVARREIQGVVKSLGTVQFQESVTVRSQRSGTIEKLQVAQGDRVRRGQVLAE